MNNNAWGLSENGKFKHHEFNEEHFLDLNLYQCGQERCDPHHTYGPAVRRHYLYHAILSGRGELETGGQKYYLEEGQGFLLMPGQLATYTASNSSPWEYAWLEFDGMKARELILLAGLSERAPIFIPVSEEAGNQVQEQLMYIIDHPADNIVRLIGHALIFLDQLALSSSRKVNVGNRHFRDFYLREALAFISNNYQRDMSVEEIAQVCGLNRSYFGRIFKEAMGKSPQQFLLQYRMNRAAELLKGSRLSIRDVGASVGYENQLHFSRAFKSVYDVPPREYRKSHFIVTEQD